MVSSHHQPPLSPVSVLLHFVVRDSDSPTCSPGAAAESVCWWVNTCFSPACPTDGSSGVYGSRALLTECEAPVSLKATNSMVF